MTPDQVLAFLTQQRTQSRSGIANFYAVFEDLYDRKLWHQLTKKIEEFVKTGNHSEGEELIQLYENFIVDFEQRINSLSLVQIGLAAAKQFTDTRDAIAFLQKIAAKVKSQVEPYVLIVMEMAAYQLALGDTVSCKKAIEECEKLLDSLPGVEPVIHASFYRVCASFDQVRKNYAGFYKNSLLYLACVSLESLSQEEKVQRTYDLGIAALLGETIFNFGELLAHDILQVLQGTRYEWVVGVLNAFNSGNIPAFESLFPVVQQESLLVENLAFLQQKIRLMSLIEIIFHLSADKRNLSFERIAEGTRLEIDQVELLLMKAMSLKLIKGIIDQVDGVVSVTWVQPRVLDKTQIAALRSRMQQWNHGVDETMKKMLAQTPELFVQ